MHRGVKDNRKTAFRIVGSAVVIILGLVFASENMLWPYVSGVSITYLALKIDKSHN